MDPATATEYVINPATKRSIRVGGRTHRALQRASPNTAEQERANKDPSNLAEPKRRVVSALKSADNTPFLTRTTSFVDQATSLPARPLKVTARPPLRPQLPPSTATRRRRPLAAIVGGADISADEMSDVEPTDSLRFPVTRTMKPEASSAPATAPLLSTAAVAVPPSHFSEDDTADCPSEETSDPFCELYGPPPLPYHVDSSYDDYLREQDNLYANEILDLHGEDLLRAYHDPQTDFLGHLMSILFPGKARD